MTDCIREIGVKSFAIILGANYKNTLHPLTKGSSISLVEFGNLPILQHQLIALSTFGITDVIMTFDGVIPHAVAAQFYELAYQYQIEITIIDSGSSRSTLEELLSTRAVINSNDDVVVLNASVVFNAETLIKLRELKFYSTANLTFLLLDRNSDDSYDLLVDDTDGRVGGEFGVPCRPAGGLYLMSKNLFTLLEKMQEEKGSVRCEREVLLYIADNDLAHAWYLESTEVFEDFHDYMSYVKTEASYMSKVATPAAQHKWVCLNPSIL